MAESSADPILRRFTHNHISYIHTFGHGLLIFSHKAEADPK